MKDDITDELELLFAEVTALAGCLRASVRQTHAPQGLSLAGHSVLRLLEEQEAMTVPQLARRRGTSRQSLQVMVDRLAEAGWVEPMANPDHQRSERLRLTPAGGRLLQTANEQQAAWLARLLPHISEQALRTSINQLRLIHTRLRSLPGQPGPRAEVHSPRRTPKPAFRRRQHRRPRTTVEPDVTRAGSPPEPPSPVGTPDRRGGIEELPVTLL